MKSRVPKTGGRVPYIKIAVVSRLPMSTTTCFRTLKHAGPPDLQPALQLDLQLDLKPDLYCTALYRTVQYCTIPHDNHGHQDPDARGQQDPDANGHQDPDAQDPDAHGHQIWPCGSNFRSGPVPGSPFFDQCFLCFAILGPSKACFDKLDR